jgi:hypothetical protein
MLSQSQKDKCDAKGYPMYKFRKAYLRELSFNHHLHLHLLLLRHHHHNVHHLSHTTSLRTRHTLHLLGKRAPIIRLQFRILDSFLRPLLMQSTNMVLTFLEEEELVAYAFYDENAAGVLLDDGFFVLFCYELALTSTRGPLIDY